MNWKLHVLKLALLTRLPFGNALRRAKRRIFGYPPDTANLRSTLVDLSDMERELRELHRTFGRSTVLEIGSGWFPTVPIALCLRGATRVYMTDLSPHMDDITFAATVSFLNSEGGEFSQLSRETRTSDLPIVYLAPFDPDQITDGTIDYVVSRTVLEHIPPRELELFLRRLRSKLSHDALMVHCVDHSDHLEHRDKSLSKVNFLTWPRWKHKFVNWLTNEGENRLRHSDYLRLFQRSGYRIVAERGWVHEDTKARVSTLNLAPDFGHLGSSEIATLKSIYVLAVDRDQPLD